MDPFEGIQEDPLSLHKYLYVHGNPVNGLDPSGNFMILDLVISFAPRVAMYERRFKYVRMGYQAYTRVSDAIDVAKAVYWVGALTAAMYFDAAAHAETDQNDDVDFTFDVADTENDDMFDAESSQPAQGGVGLVALFLLFEEAAKQGHHIATDKHKTEWTPKFERLFKKAGITLQNTANVVDVKGHGGPHADEYHKEIHRRLTLAVQGTKPGSPKMKKRLLAELKKLSMECARPGSPLNQMVIKRIYRR